MSLPNEQPQTPVAQRPVTQSVYNGVIPPQFRMSDWLSKKGLDKINWLLQFARAFCNPQVKRGGTTDQLIISDSNWTLLLQAMAAGGGGGGGGGAAQEFVLTGVFGSYVTGTSGATTYYIAKHYHLRHDITGETKLGVAHTYTYAAIAGNLDDTRVDSWDPGSGTVNQSQRVIPPWVSGAKVTAVPCSISVDTTWDTGTSSAPQACTWIMITPRMWGQQDNT